ncbi:MAG: hypothetical protein UX62_C0010G0002 [Microgenomates group bacterium GW2011_GWA2_46_7]|nr:MAG: hypothetical protein UX62_C0010G0002 [Microgenomates group bacterium GW2011_GWA2_46_7]
MYMSRTVVQIPLSTDLRDQAYAMAISQGFSSLQEAMRVILHKFVKGSLSLEVYTEPAPIQLSARAIKRYDQMTKDFQSGKNISTSKNMEELMEELNYGDHQTQKVHQKLPHKSQAKPKINKEVHSKISTVFV